MGKSKRTADSVAETKSCPATFKGDAFEHGTGRNYKLRKETMLALKGFGAPKVLWGKQNFV